LNNLGVLYEQRKDLVSAANFLRQAIQIWEIRLDPDHPELARGLANLGEVLSLQRRFSEAEPLYRRALDSATASLGSEHPDVASIMYGMAKVLRNTNRKSEAKKLENTAKTVFANHAKRNLVGQTVDVREMAAAR